MQYFTLTTHLKFECCIFLEILKMYFFFNIYLFIYLAVPSLSCGS